VLAGACTAEVEPRSEPSPSLEPTAPEATDPPTGGVVASGPLARRVCGLPRRHLLRIWRGYDPDRSGELQLVPDEPNVIGPGYPHAGVADHLQDVPLLLYGPGLIGPGRRIRRPVTVADVAPTIASLIGFELPAPDGRPLREAVVAGADPAPLVVTVVWDGGGRGVLDEWPGSWPTLRRLIEGGTWYERASVGSSPSTSAPVHATIGTGAFPQHHGLIGNALRVGGRIVDPWEDGPDYLRSATLADLYDPSAGNAALIGLIGSAQVQLGLVGHGASWDGGDRDIAVLKRRRGYERPDGFWGVTSTSRDAFATPSYVNKLPFITAYHRAADLLDGRADGAWLGESIDLLRNGFDTPARIPFETRLVEEVVRREGFGEDDVPDILYLNYKLIDYVGHRWSLHSRQMRHAIAVQDAALADIVRFLDRQVGRGRWALVLTADHGSQPDPARAGGRRIDISAIDARIRSRFDDGDARPVVDQVQTSQVFLDVGELAANGHTLQEVAADLMAAEPGLAAAFPSELLSRLTCLPEARDG
jgi:Type I phosphodiesterase / nucleotide pyrophosphatase